ncbi:MAG TPA: peptidylprolyl isomerase [Chloroflexota bacterium]|nr:peptidylprolyl isomerase [Chloroflexota bacterium]
MQRWVLPIAVVLLAACSPPSSAARPTPPPTVPPRTAVPTAAATAKQWPAPPPMTIDPAHEYIATLHTTMGDITIELLPQEAPKTVNNFVFLAREGFYDNVKFHRIIKDFMIQTGDPQGTGLGGPGYRFEDEPVRRAYEPGIVAMANAGPNTNGSQFFIVHGPQARTLPPNYTIFGRVIAGMDVVDRIANVPVRPNPRGEPSVPTQDVRIVSIEIDERGS